MALKFWKKEGMEDGREEEWSRKGLAVTVASSILNYFVYEHIHLMNI